MGMEMGAMGDMDMNTGTRTNGGHAGHMRGMDLFGDDQAGGMSEMESAGPVVARHGPGTHGPGNTAVATVQRNRLAEPGTGASSGH